MLIQKHLRNWLNKCLTIAVVPTFLHGPNSVKYEWKIWQEYGIVPMKPAMELRCRVSQ